MEDEDKSEEEDEEEEVMQLKHAVEFRTIIRFPKEIIKIMKDFQEDLDGLPKLVDVLRSQSLNLYGNLTRNELMMV